MVSLSNPKSIEAVFQKRFKANIKLKQSHWSKKKLHIQKEMKTKHKKESTKQTKISICIVFPIYVVYYA